VIDSTYQGLGILVILLTLVTIVIVTQFIRRRRDLVALRRIPAYERLPVMAGQSIEAGRPLHISLGSAGIGGESTVLTITSAELAYQLARRTATGDAPPILTLSAASALPLGQDTLRRAYQSRGLPERYKARNVRWYPSGAGGLAFAGGVAVMMHEDRIVGNVMAGSYGPELALILDTSARHGLPSIAVSDQLEGQAVAYAMADDALIGEEIFAAGSYLGGGASQIGESVAIDLLRWLLIAVLVIAFVAGLVNGG
jgi:hypothetical protein